MPNGTNNNDIHALKQEVDTSNRKIHLAREKLKILEEKKNQLTRYYREDNEKHRALKEKLETAKQNTLTNLQNEQETLGQIQGTFEKALSSFLEVYSDPATHINTMNSRYPILMMPLRIETRFRKVKDQQNLETDQLWVRIFPDDCSIDTFEEILSETEIENGQDFWSDWLIAAGKENGQRAAWRTLVDSHGAGRAQYILNNYRPEGAEEMLTQENDEENPSIYLVIPITQGSISRHDQQELIAYWEEVWRANGNIERINAAFGNIQPEEGEDQKQYLIHTFIPKNIDDDFSSIEDRDDAEISVRFLVFPSEETQEKQQDTWTRAPRVSIMPERIYLIGYRNNVEKLRLLGNPIPFVLECGPDPGAGEDEKIDYLDGDLQITPGMKWMVDFDEAVSKGMGFIVGDDQDQEHQVHQGYDRLIAVGVRLSADKKNGKELTETLLHNHYFGNSGFSFLPVGTPTNNTQEKGSGYTEREDPDDSYNQLFVSKDDDEDEDTHPWWAITDRHQFNKMLGLNPEFFHNALNTDGFDQLEARAMNIALWPATLGYMFDTMLQSVFSDHQIANLRSFFNFNVSGRGFIPSIRIDDQPYGVLPTTAFSKIQWFRPYYTDMTHWRTHSNESFYHDLYIMLLNIQGDWKNMVSDVPHIRQEGDPYQIMMDVLGHHGGSVEFHTRIAQSINHLYNLFVSLYKNYASTGENFDKIVEAFNNYIEAQHNASEGWALLRKLGYKEAEIPEIYDKYFAGNATPVDYLVDDQRLSEEKGIRAYASDERNYIEWLIDTAKISLNKLREQVDFIDNKRPKALLYLMLHHAMELGYHTTALQLCKTHELFTTDEMARWAQREPDFIHISGPKSSSEEQEESGSISSAKPIHSLFPSESRYYLLEQKIETITGDNERSIAQYITDNLNAGAEPAAYIHEQIKALEYLKNIPTARLERLLSEHLDCVSYRFDAWKWGLLHYQISSIRETQYPNANDDNNDEHSAGEEGGLYLGAYGWLEHVFPEDKTLTPITLFRDSKLQETFQPDADHPIMQDDSNQGYIQAPSLNQAVTASVLRNAYLSNASKENADVFGINLSSERVRKALSVLEGIRQGQSLAALLGYHFERYLHDYDGELFLDRFIAALRRQFSLVSDQMASTQSDDDDYQNAPIEALEAKNVVNGTDLLEFVEKNQSPNGEADYFDKLNIPDASTREKQAIIKGIHHIRDINDAVADLSLAEGLHQVVQGNIERAAGTYDTYSKGNYPQMPDIIKTPRSGVNVTHRVGVQINPEPGSSASDDDSPRSMAEPGLNAFLADILPGLNKIRCHVTLRNPDTGVDVPDYPVTMEMLGVQPIDLLFMISDESDQAMTSLDDQIVHYIMNKYEPEPGKKLRADTDIQITYYIQNDPEDVDETVSVFEMMPLIRHLRSILLQARALRPEDVSLPNETDSHSAGQITLDPTRMEAVMGYLNDILNEGADQSLKGFITVLEGLRNEEGWTDETEITGSIDEYLDAMTSILHELSVLGLPNTGYGYLYTWQNEKMGALIQKIKKVLKRWNNKENRYDDIMNDYDSADSDEKINILMKAERVVSSTPTLDPDPATFHSTVQNKKNHFSSHKGKFEDFLQKTHQGISHALEHLKSKDVLSYEEFDFENTDISDIRKATLICAEDLFKKAKTLDREITKRITTCEKLKSDHDTEADPERRAELLQEMARELLSEDFKMIPSFEMLPEKRGEWSQALQPENIDQLLAYQKEELNHPLPVDDWFHGTARVREKMGHLEQIMFWTEGFKDLAIELTPVQLPRLDPYCWFALEFGAAGESDNEALKKVFLENDHLLYTCYYHHPFNPDETEHCGLLVDEWTETIPTEEETVGTAFHYDRPNSEPPQTMLLITSPQMEENWQWQDLVDAVNETLDEAKLRGVEPQQIDNNGYACFLPATIAAVTFSPVTIAVNYALSNQYYATHQPSDNE